MTDIAARTVLFSVLLLAVPSLANAEVAWLPAEIREEIAQELAEKFEVADDEGRLPEDLLPGARRGVDAMVAKLEVLGAERVIELAPEYPDLQIPSSGQPHLDAIAQYGACTFALEVVFADDSPRENGSLERISAAVMSTWVLVTSAYLRGHYLGEGTTDEDARAYLAGEELSAISERIQSSQEMLQYTLERCSGPLTNLMQ